MKKLAAALASIVATACATAPAPADPVAGDPSLPHCNPAVLARFVGQTATSDVGARMLAATGARTIRWVPPGTMVTMDYRFDRLTVRLGDDGRITQASCT